ncbi:ferrous iron transport protein B [Vibrio breoganii]|uniref:Fe(2+) transporter permease subunit FeoB n=1 Tax=Vibrio breoganii TaxID=553239 RepID=UPI000C865BB1|nr:Fe(2+) transporter permease subunit FeoB [Vibrio breoganii]PMG82790.1 ferrous iron transport protein B [Vibrio breoganii]PML27603.1 ferrous iron transport protein B [Vibrio breoganii]PMM88918.1 ferrous iron transport protein B [Vibrio breoganii]PMO30748.1 ferrous iron transport protein B [Vibrio breoganii]PMO65036.1 ferrous iron transport protein B [Vibrio breoganii]
MDYSILTVGNPNSGKTTLFNAFTGANQKVGNWAGVTVEKKTGLYSLAGEEFSLTDLPGIYALDSGNDNNSLDETIASRAVLSTPADVIINVIDATCLERSLYVTLQLRELGRPMIVILNKMDALARMGQKVNIKGLSKALGCPVMAVTATRINEVNKLKADLHKMLATGIEVEPLALDYGAQFEEVVSDIQDQFENDMVSNRALAIRALENDQLVMHTVPAEVKDATAQARHSLDMDIDLHIADVKFTFLHELSKSFRTTEGKITRRLSEKIDAVVLNKWIGVPLFFGVMYLMFMFAINIGGAFIDFFDIAFGAVLVDGTHALLDPVLPAWMVTLLADGVGGGIQTVATFIPVIAGLYLFLTLLEGSGYMSRAAFVLDKVMQKVGLPGKAFVPLVLGFGCNVPAIMASRTLDQERERRLAASMAPFMSCGARLPVYALFAAAFFPSAGQNVVFALYVIGILAAVFTGFILKNTIYPGSNDSFVMEMTDYEIPRLRNVIIKTWQKLKRFVFGAGKTIVVVVTILSFLNSIGTDGSFGNEDSENSVLSKAAQVITPVFEPMGIEQDNWPATVGIVTGIFAKEAVVGTLNNLYASPSNEEAEFDLMASLEEAVMSIPENLSGLSFSDPLGIEVGDLTDTQAVADDQEVDQSVFANLQGKFANGHAAFAYLLFILLYTPCVAAMGAYVREFGAQYARFIAVWTMGLGYFGAVLYNQVMNFSAHPGKSAIWILAVMIVSVATYLGLKHHGSKQQFQEQESAA